MTSRRWLNVLSATLALMSARPASAWTLLGWSDLGIQAIDADYSVLATQPPSNTFYAQLSDDNGLLIGDATGITVTYEAVADPTGSITRISSDKTNFWQYVEALFGLSLPAETGLSGFAMPGAANQPQAMRFDAGARWFVAAGVPITPSDDSKHVNPYPLMHLVARNVTNGAILATTDIVLPVSDEMNCAACHASGATPAAQPAAGWVNDPDPQRDTRLNILRLHDDRQRSTAAFQDALAAAHYDAAGLFVTATNGTPVLCVRCHASAAVSGSGLSGITPLTQAVHRRMANVYDPVSGGLLDMTATRAACYRCHPGVTTRALRGVMGTAVADDGARAIECQSCHGHMLDVGASGRSGWVDEPVCQSCHTGTAMHNNGALRFTSAFDANGQARAAVDTTFATNPDTPAPGQSLFRFSKGHGGLACSACHGSAHAEFPSAQPNDNLQSIAAQGHVGVLVECTGCHGSSPDTVTGGPHGMHPVGQDWIDRHADAVDQYGHAGCQQCHGADLRGTVLTRTHAERELPTAFGPRTFWRGFQIGCYACHQHGSKPNHEPLVADAAVTTRPGTATVIALTLSDEDGDALSLRIVSQPSHGTAAVADTHVTYFPEPDFTGNDAFTLAASDGLTESNLGTLHVTVTSAVCAGDCDGSGTVDVTDIITMVNIALGAAPVNGCAAGDVSGDGVIDVAEIIVAVNHALNGDCAA